MLAMVASMFVHRLVLVEPILKCMYFKMVRINYDYCDCHTPPPPPDRGGYNFCRIFISLFFFVTSRNDCILIVICFHFFSFFICTIRTTKARDLKVKYLKYPLKNIRFKMFAFFKILYFSILSEAMQTGTSTYFAAKGYIMHTLLVATIISIYNIFRDYYSSIIIERISIEDITWQTSAHIRLQRNFQ